MSEPFALAGRVLIDGALHEGAVVVAGADIVDIELENRPLPGDIRRHPIIAPGLIDLQVNGAFGDEVGADVDALARISARLPSTGVTSWLPTLVTSTRAECAAALDAFARSRTLPSGEGAAADALGLHLEGPLLAPEKKGAHRAEPMAPADARMLDELCASGLVKLVTLAPERAGAVDAVRSLRSRGVVVALGHSIASAPDTLAAVDAGAAVVTHLFNAMPPIAGRSPGIAGVALVDARLTCCLIVDFIHVDRTALELAILAKSPARICLVTDAMAAAGCGAGRYKLGGLDVDVAAEAAGGVAARLASDGSLAGSVLTLDQAVRNAATTSLGVAGALSCASEVPARVLGLRDRGRIARGMRADVACFDDELRVLETYIAGQRRAPSAPLP